MNTIQEIRYQVGEAWKGAYNAATSYSLAAVVQDATGLSVYRSLKSGNAGHPLTDASWWFKIIDFSTIKTEAEQVAALNQAIAEAEAIRVANEEGRVSAETARSNAESRRVESEQTRNSSETQRTQNEQTRQSAEQLRQTNEENRVAAESSREAKESTRQQSETSRQNAETQRQTAETNRASAESQRILDENARQSAEAARESRADSDHQTAVQDNAQMTELVERADADHEQAATDHTTATSDHTRAGSDHTTATTDHATATGDHTQAGTDHTASVAATEAATEAAESANALQENLENGTVIPALAENLTSWADGSETSDYVQTDVADTAGGTLSIDSSVNAELMSVVPQTDFGATSLIATGFNLLRYATAVGSGWYILVPKLTATAASIGTANENNGGKFFSLRHILRIGDLC